VNPLRNPRIGAPVACVGAPVLLVVDTANRQDAASLSAHAHALGRARKTQTSVGQCVTKKGRSDVDLEADIDSSTSALLESLDKGPDDQGPRCQLPSCGDTVGSNVRMPRPLGRPAGYFPPAR
jgi:hypothetical protein